MKNNCIFLGLFFLLLGLSACNNYENKNIKYQATTNVQSLKLFVGQEFKLIASPSSLKFNWTSSDPSIATVSSDGLVTAVSRGAANIIAKSGDVICTVPVDTEIRVAMVDYELSARWLELAQGGSIEVKVFYIPTDANDMGFPEWSTDDPEVATVTYAGRVKCLKLGETKIHCNIDGIKKTIPVKVSDILPFPEPHILKKNVPLIVHAKWFDYGGKGVAWWDSDNHDGNMKDYRKDLGDPGCTVDIETGESPYNDIGWTNSGEWLQYSIDVMESGEYLFDCYVGCNGNNKGYYLDINVGEYRTADYPFVSWGGGWQGYRWYHTVESFGKPNYLGPILNLPEGRQKIRFKLNDGNFNFAAIRFTAKRD